MIAFIYMFCFIYLQDNASTPILKRPSLNKDFVNKVKRSDHQVFFLSPNLKHLDDVMFRVFMAAHLAKIQELTDRTAVQGRRTSPAATRQC